MFDVLLTGVFDVPLTGVLYFSVSGNLSSLLVCLTGNLSWFSLTGFNEIGDSHLPDLPFFCEIASLDWFQSWMYVLRPVIHFPYHY